MPLNLNDPWLFCSGTNRETDVNKLTHDGITRADSAGKHSGAHQFDPNFSRLSAEEDIYETSLRVTPVAPQACGEAGAIIWAPPILNGFRPAETRPAALLLGHVCFNELENLGQTHMWIPHLV